MDTAKLFLFGRRQVLRLPKQYRFRGNKVAAELAFGVANSGSARNRQALEMFLAP